MARVFVALVSILCTGCGMAVQTAMGWTDAETRHRHHSEPVQISTVPAGAEVCRLRGDGSCASVKPSPFEDTIAVEYEEVVETPSTLGLWLGAGVSVVVAVVGASLAPSECGSNGVSCPVVPLLMAFGAGFGAVLDMMVAVFYSGFMTEEEIQSKRVIEAPRVRYRAEKEGYERASGEIDATTDRALVLRLEPVLDAPDLALVDATKGEMIVTVPPVTSTDADLAWLEALSHRLHLDVTAAGVKTVETGALDRMLREAQCAGDDCDIEVGRALAASHVLRARVTRLGERCVLAAELVDLAREVIVTAASARGTCDDDRIVDQLTAGVARALFTGPRPGTSAP